MTVGTAGEAAGWTSKPRFLRKASWKPGEKGKDVLTGKHFT